mgnify:CR=1 FL=1
MSFKQKLLSESEISSFCQQVNMVVKAGLPTYYGISILRDEATDDFTRDFLNKIYEPMERGVTLGEALANTHTFPEYMVDMIRLGEETGRLEEVLDSLSIYYEREADIKAGIRHAVTYPLIMTIMMLVVIVVIITQVVPVFSQIYEQLGSGLTGSALMLMNISNFLNRYMLTFVIAIVALAVTGIIFFRTPLGKSFIHGRSLSLSIAASRFANCMYLALSSGLDTDRSLEMAKKLIDNPYMLEKIEQCKKHIKNGEPFIKSLLLSGIFSKVYSSIMTIGFKTGSLDDIMHKISISYEEETDEKLRHFISILEPTLIVILSFFIGLILISFLLPLLGIMSSIG